MKHNWLFALVIASTVLLSCSKPDVIEEVIDNVSEETENNENGNKPVAKKNILEGMLHIHSKEIGIFELTSFTFSRDNDENPSLFPMAELIENFDSVAWTASNFEGTFQVFYRDKSSMKFSSKWSQNFFLPGEYTTFLLGYKDGNVISKDSAFFQVVNNKDFLCYNWNEIKENDKNSTGYHDNFSENYFTTYRTIHNNVPSVSLGYRISTKNDKEYIDSQIMRRQKLYDYLNILYSKPNYDSGDEEITERYNQLFHYKEKGAKPVSIWITNQSNIVLLEYFDDWYKINTYSVYAEPRTK